MVTDMLNVFDRISTLGPFAVHISAFMICIYIFLILIQSLEYLFLDIIVIADKTITLFLILSLVFFDYFDRWWLYDVLDRAGHHYWGRQSFIILRSRQVVWNFCISCRILIQYLLISGRLHKFVYDGAGALRAYVVSGSW